MLLSKSSIDKKFEFQLVTLFFCWLINMQIILIHMTNEFVKQSNTMGFI